MKQKLTVQKDDIQAKRANFLQDMAELQRDVSELENVIVERRIEMADLHNKNEKIGFEVKDKKNKVEIMEVEVRDLKKTFDNLEDLEREKKAYLINIDGSRKRVTESVKDHQHAQILDLERAIREAEIVMQRRKANMQKMAEILSGNVNRVIVDTINTQRLKTLQL